MPPARRIRRVLIANRGEIAVRVIRSCMELGIETVAVFSEPDRLAPHVLMADQAIEIGPALAAASYLNADKLIAACKSSGADALHPGYGFLSENADFAELCAKNEILFVGPPATAIRMMGSKTTARASMEQAGVPVVPGRSGPDRGGFPDAHTALAAAEEIGFPVLVKASAGGGGKGMRTVETAQQFEAAFDAARREARAAFGDDVVYLEKAIIGPRHVEIQVFADAAGNIVHLGERDCSLQRRHQKVIEESPCPALTDDLRTRMGKSAIQAAAACSYVGAGTVEFLLADGEYYFLEMNTRLQVEHPVTELLYGVDLVAWQFAIAAGRPLPMDQKALDASRRGAAIECRIYAEDSVRFLPSPGRIEHLRTPAGPYVRVDSGVYEGFEVTPDYDPMISKLIVWGRDRKEALARMRRALAEYSVQGIETNLGFHHQVLGHPGFCAGDYHTGFIAQEPTVCEAEQAQGDRLYAGLAVAAIAKTSTQANASQPAPRPDRPSAWRLAGRLL